MDSGAIHAIRIISLNGCTGGPTLSWEWARLDGSWPGLAQSAWGGHYWKSRAFPGRSDRPSRAGEKTIESTNGRRTRSSHGFLGARC